MIKWDEYVKQLLTEPDSLDDISISIDKGKSVMPIPPIIKVSILMLNKMIEKQGYKQILVFPERKQTALILVLASVIHDISIGKIEMKYDPGSFHPGEKLKLGNAIVEFLGVEDKYLSLHMADLDKFSVPMSMLPMLQKTDTKRTLSKKKKFATERKKILDKRQKMSGEAIQSSSILSEYKTHMGSSVYYVSSITSVKEQLLTLRICGDKASDLFLISQVDYEGNINNIGAGQLKGIPAIILASDLYAVNSSLEKGNPVHSIMVDVVSIDTILTQLDVLDRLLARKIPMILVTDIVNSFKLETFVNRGFNIWRWYKENLTSELYDVTLTIADKKIRNCARKEMQYINVVGNEISESAKILSKYRKGIQEQSVSMMKLYEILINILFRISRDTVPLNRVDCESGHSILNKCQKILDDEINYISKEMFTDYELVIQNYLKVYSVEYISNKYNALCKVLEENKNKKIIILIPEMMDKRRIEDFWKLWVVRRMFHIDIKVYFPTEYYSSENVNSDITIIVGWLKHAIMRKVIFSCNTEKYLVLLFDHENRWKNYAIKKWSIAQRCSNNREIIQQSLSDEKSMILVSSHETENQMHTDNTIEEDELEEINTILRENKYKQFANGELRKNGEIVEAIPINFVGGFLSFYQKGHKSITATKIIMGIDNKIEIVFPEQLRVGDFVVVRESGRDIVKEIADMLLKNSNMDNLRELATMWREVIKRELLFVTEDVFIKKMSIAGCDKGIATIKNWIDDEDMIAPREREDLQYIADATGNKELKEMLDNVYEAANKVRSTHVQAGGILSQQLKSKLVDVLKNYGSIDSINFWEPIEIEVEDIGIVKVLKVIDRGNIIHVDSSNTNRLIEESKI